MNDIERLINANALGASNVAALEHKACPDCYLEVTDPDFRVTIDSKVRLCQKHGAVDELIAALAYIKQFCGGRLQVGTAASRLAAKTCHDRADAALKLVEEKTRTRINNS